MAIKLNDRGYAQAESMIRKGLEVSQVSNDWKEVKPDVDDELRYLESHSLDEYGNWYLGIDTSAPSNERSRYIYPFGDFNILHESGLITAEEEAKKNGHNEIAEAASKLRTKLTHREEKK